MQRQGMLNSRLPTDALMELSLLEKTVKKIFYKVVKHHQLSIRSQQKVLRVARTIADLELSAKITDSAIIEAVSFRAFDQLLKKARNFI